MVLAIIDGDEGDQQRSPLRKAQSGYGVFLVKQVDGGFIVNLALIRSHRGARVTSSSFDIECVSTISAVDHALAVSLLCLELEQGPRDSILERVCNSIKDGTWDEQHESNSCSEWDTRAPQVVLHGDADSVVVNANSVKQIATMSQRRAVDMADLRECLSQQTIKEFRAIKGTSNPLDAVTKDLRKTVVTRGILREILESGYYWPDYQENKRQKAGMRFNY